MVSINNVHFFDMLSIFSKSGNTSVGIDIGTTSIKIVEVVCQGKRNFRLSNYGILETAGHLEHFNNALQSSSLKPLDTDLVTYLSFLKNHLKLKPDKVYASLPAFTAFTTLLELPIMSDKETDRSLGDHVKSYIPLPLTTVTLDWIKVGEKTYSDGSKKQQVFLISIPNEKIENYTSIFVRSGLEIEAVETENASLARALTLSEEKPQLIIDIGGRSTSFSVAKKGELRFSGQIDFSSGSLTQALATALNISLRRADKLKKQTIVSEKSGDHELSTIMLPIIDVIIKEAKRIQGGFEKGYGENVTGVLVSGGGANIEGIVEYISQKIKLPVKKANVLSALTYPPEIGTFSEELGTTLAVATGLALKKFEKNHDRL